MDDRIHNIPQTVMEFRNCPWISSFRKTSNFWYCDIREDKDITIGPCSSIAGLREEIRGHLIEESHREYLDIHYPPPPWYETRDAKVWAEKFCEENPEMDRETMEMWFDRAFSIPFPVAIA